MWFWWFMLCIDLITPVFMIAFGRMLWKHPPKNINGFIGYRTTRSMKNTDTWKFAQEYCGKLWWKIGWIILVPSAVIHLPFYHAPEDTIEVVSVVLELVQVSILISTIFPVEKALKNTFQDDLSI